MKYVSLVLTVTVSWMMVAFIILIVWTISYNFYESDQLFWGRVFRAAMWGVMGALGLKLLLGIAGAAGMAFGLMSANDKENCPQCGTGISPLTSRCIGCQLIPIHPFLAVRFAIWSWPVVGIIATPFVRTLLVVLVIGIPILIGYWLIELFRISGLSYLLWLAPMLAITAFALLIVTAMWAFKELQERFARWSRD